MRQVLVVEDDPGLGPLLAEYLTEEGFHATVETNGQRAVSRILSERPDLVLLDLNLPGLDGFEVHRAIRPQYDGIVIVLTARRADLDHVAALEMGADDYVTKPVDPRVLFARVKAHLRRSLIERSKRDVEPIRLAVGPLQIDRAARRALIGNARVDLTGLEFELLWTLARAAGTVVARERLYEEVLGTRYDGLDRGVDSHMSRIRRKLRDAGAASELIFAIRGQGYQLVST
jgi:DNA-binding response OmpR family regulator